MCASIFKCLNSFFFLCVSKDIFMTNVAVKEAVCTSCVILLVLSHLECSAFTCKGINTATTHVNKWYFMKGAEVSCVVS